MTLGILKVAAVLEQGAIPMNILRVTAMADLKAV